MTKEIIPNKFPLKRLNPFDEGKIGFEKGKSNQKRAFQLFGELVEDGVFLSVRRASKKQNTAGIDLFGTVPLDKDDEIALDQVGIPFQIKSSRARAREFRMEHRGDRRKIQVLVVNDSLTDKRIKGVIRSMVRNFLTSKGLLRSI